MGKYSTSPLGPVSTKELELLHSTSHSLFLVSGSEMLGAILLETTQESMLAMAAIEGPSLTPDKGMLTSGQIDTPGPVRLIREFESLTRSSTYVVTGRHP